MLIKYNYPLYNPSSGYVSLNGYKASFIDLSKVVSRSHSDNNLVTKIRAKYFKPLSAYLHIRHCTVQLIYKDKEYQWLNTSRSGGYNSTKVLLKVVNQLKKQALPLKDYPKASYSIKLKNVRCLNATT